MKTKTKIAGALAIILASSLTVGTAQAAPEASAESIVTVQNFQIFRGGTNTQIQASDLTLTNVSSTEKVQASVGATTVAPPQTSVNNGANIASQAVIPVISQANVAAEFAANNTTTQSAFTAASTFPMNGTFAASGANDFGSPIANFGVSTANAATLYNASYASLNTGGTAGTSSNSGLSAKFGFTGIAGILDLRFNAGAYIAAFLTSGDAVSAKAAYSITFNLTDATIGFVGQNALNGGQFNLNSNVSDGTPGLGTPFTSTIAGLTGTQLNVLPFQISTLNLDATHTYNFTATITTDSNVELTTVPEPELLTLLGVGLLGFAVSLGKKKV